MGRIQKKEGGPSMHFNRLTLAFSGVHANLEPDFQKYYFHSTLNQIRIAIFAALVFYGAFGVLDRIVAYDNYMKFWVIRYAVVCPAILLVFLFSYCRSAHRFLQPVVSLGTLICGCGIIAMAQLTSPIQNYSYVGGLVQITFYIFTFARLRFIWGSTVACSLVPAYLIATMALGSSPGNYIIGKGFHLTLVCLMGMMAGYAIEYQTRKNFYLSRQLESRKRRLAISNEFLEDRVAKRTAELKHTNELLKAEINERKMIEIALRDSQKRYRRMVNNVTDYICVYGLTGKILEANTQMTSGLGYSLEELYAMNYQDLLPPDDSAAFPRHMADIRRKGSDSGTMTCLTKDGAPRVFEYSNVLAEHANGHQAVFSLARDISDRKRAEKALADSQTRFHNIFETAAAGMAIIDSRNRKVVEINAAAAEMVGEKAQWVKGQLLDRFIRMPVDQDYRHLPVPTPNPMECLLITARDDTLPILASTQATVFNDQPHWIFSFINIQKIKEAEAAKRELEIRSNRAQHLEAIGTLAGGIAHDFNNILFGIMGFAELALEDAPADSIQASNIVEIINGGHRAKDMIHQILTFSRRNNFEKSAIVPDSLIKEALKLLRASLPSSIELRTRFEPHLNKIVANPTHVHQVIMNLCTNAAHALGDNNGRIEIEISNVILENEIQTHHGTIGTGEYVRLTVSDNGAGIAPAIIDRIYEPFFTTKPQGEGTGMGLSVVLGIVQAHNGFIRTESQPGKGTRFEILFPAILEQQVEIEKPQVSLPKGNERIMVVDDEKSLCVMLERMLTSLGYQVTICRHPDEAVSIFKKQPGAYNLIMSDLTMPGKTGTRLARELLQIQKDLPIILCSGNGEKIDNAHLHALGIRDLLHKPILKRDLAAAIRRALDAN